MLKKFCNFTIDKVVANVVCCPLAQNTLASLWWFFEVVDGSAFLQGEVTPSNAKRATWDVLIHSCATGNKAVIPNGKGSDKVAVATDKTIFANGRFVLEFAIVVDKNHATTNVCVGANKGIANVGKVAGFDTAFEHAVFDFHKVANATTIAYHGIVPEVRVWANCAILPHLAIDNARTFDNCVCTNYCTIEITKTAHHAPVVQNGVALDNGIRLDCYVCAHFDGWFQNVVHTIPLID